jgi:hypothetical protein
MLRINRPRLYSPTITIERPISVINIDKASIQDLEVALEKNLKLLNDEYVIECPPAT